MPSKRPNSIYDRDGNFDIELYCIRTTRASKVPLKVEDQQVLGMVERLLPKPVGARPKKAKTTTTRVPREIVDVELPEPPAPQPQ